MKDTLKKGVQGLQKCEDMIAKLGLFSANETKDDISTTNLKYILVGRGSQFPLLVIREFPFRVMPFGLVSPLPFLRESLLF